MQKRATNEVFWRSLKVGLFGLLEIAYVDNIEWS